MPTPGRLQVVNRDLYYSPNCSRDLILDALSNNPFTPAGTQPSTVQYEQLLNPRPWSLQFGWISTISKTLAFREGYPFDQIKRIPPPEVIYTCTKDREELDLFAMQQDVKDTWIQFERDLYATVVALKSRYNVAMVLPFLPWGLGYASKFKTERGYYQAVKKSRNWFAIWFGALTYLIAVAEAQVEDPIKLRLNLPRWQEVVCATVGPGWMDGIARSHIADFRNKPPRVGCVIDLAGHSTEQPSISWFIKYQIPVWYRWSDFEERLSKQRPSVLKYRPPQFSECLSQAIPPTPSQFMRDSPLSPPPSSHQSRTPHFTPSPPSLDARSPPFFLQAIPPTPSRYDRDSPLSPPPSSHQSQTPDFTPFPPSLDAQSPPFPLQSSYNSPPSHSFVSPAAITTPSPTFPIPAAEPSDFTSLDVVESATQERGWESHFRRHEEKHKRILASESAIEKQSRESRAANPPVQNVRVFEWNPSDDNPKLFERVAARIKYSRDVLEQYGPQQKRFDAFCREWDCCEGWGPDPSDDDEDLEEFNMGVYIGPSRTMNDTSEASITQDQSPGPPRDSTSVAGLVPSATSIPTSHPSSLSSCDPTPERPDIALSRPPPSVPNPIISERDNERIAAEDSTTFIPSLHAYDPLPKPQAVGAQCTLLEEETCATSSLSLQVTATALGHALLYEVIEIFSQHYGFVPPLPDQRINVEIEEPSPIGSLVIRLVGATRMEERPEDFLESEFHAFALQFVKAGIRGIAPPSGTWDLRDDVVNPLKLSPRLKHLRILELPPATQSDMDSGLSDGAKRYYYFSFPASTVAWTLALSNPSDALLVCRFPESLTPEEVVLILVQRGVPFRIFWPSNVTSGPIYRNPRLQPLPTRPLDHKFTKEDYDSYVHTRTHLLGQPHLKSVLRRGGLVWRLSISTLGLSEFLHPPTGFGSVLKVEFPGQPGGAVEDNLTLSELDLICGAYECIDDKGQRKLKSWWPLVRAYEKEECGENFRRWTRRAEEWFIERLANIESNVAKPLTYKQWTSSQRGLRQIRDFHKFVQCSSLDFVGKSTTNTSPSSSSGPQLRDNLHL